MKQYILYYDASFRGGNDIQVYLINAKNRQDAKEKALIFLNSKKEVEEGSVTRMWDNFENDESFVDLKELTKVDLKDDISKIYHYTD